MHPSEEMAKKYYEDLGYTVLTKGWPDFLAYMTRDGKTIARAVEVKMGADTVKEHQEKNHEILKALGIPVDVHYVDGDKCLPVARKRLERFATVDASLRGPKKCKCGKRREKWQRSCFDCWSNPHGR